MEFSRQDEDLMDKNSSTGSLENNLQLDIEELGSLSEMLPEKNPLTTQKMTIF